MDRTRAQLKALFGVVLHPLNPRCDVFPCCIFVYVLAMVLFLCDFDCQRTRRSAAFFNHRGESEHYLTTDPSSSVYSAHRL
ncbi:hypothetical protein LENED_012793 [Lentinula edodes]|uniref:Uncharacterized protein n=1 Tax=Lentinula edodes TaxID=5353 RepID=A0A1Q3ETF8_LENED|nr:hypothetical protein LENED_012793 [Lentinula edodes]